MKHVLRTTFLLLVLMLLAGPRLHAAPLNVVVSIKPLHSLAAAVLEDVASPHLLLKAYASPHNYSLRPSDARALAEAQAIFWVGEALETFLPVTIEKLSPHADSAPLIETAGLKLYAPREGGAWEEEALEGEHHHHEKETQADPHIWLSPDNAVVLAEAMRDRLISLAPEHRERLTQNTRRLVERIRQLDTRLGETLRPARQVPYLVFHDAYQYLERHYALNAQGSVTVSPDRAPGVRRVQQIRAKIEESGARAVFSEPQFNAAILENVVEGTGALLGHLDPLGAGVPEGPGAYEALMTEMVTQLRLALEPSP